MEDEQFLSYLFSYSHADHVMEAGIRSGADGQRQFHGRAGTNDVGAVAGRRGSES